MPETINLSATRSIEQLNALIVAAEQRREELMHENLTQLRNNLKSVAKDMKVSLKELVHRLLENPAENAPPRVRRPSEEVQASKLAAARRMKYFHPTTGTGWSGMGRAPSVFRDPETGLVNQALLASCRNPDFEDWNSEAAAE